MRSRTLVSFEHPDAVSANDMLIEIYAGFLRYYPEVNRLWQHEETRSGMHAILAGKIMFDVDHHLKVTEESGARYRRDVKFTVYPENKLLIVSARAATGEPSFSLDVPFEDLLGEFDGDVSEEQLVMCLAPLIEQTKDAMRGVRALIATLKSRND